jgi:FkbM family methyltransferase
MLREERPEETVIEAAVFQEHGFFTFYDIPQTGLGTGDRSIAALHGSKGYPIQEIKVAGITLADIFALAGDRDIHWLKIDVEGMEKNVLESWGDAPHQPWVVVVESTLPNSRIETSELWEGLLLQRGYSSVYFDGVSRFYLSKDHIADRIHFTAPPNVMDAFTRGHI